MQNINQNFPELYKKSSNNARFMGKLRVDKSALIQYLQHFLSYPGDIFTAVCNDKSLSFEFLHIFQKINSDVGI